MSGYPEEAPSTTRTAADADAAPDSWIERTFRLRAHHTDLGTEILAGVTTFVTLAYILFVNPNILKDAGMPVEATFAATCLASAVATLVMGLYATSSWTDSRGYV